MQEYSATLNMGDLTGGTMAELQNQWTQRVLAVESSLIQQFVSEHPDLIGVSEREDDFSQGIRGVKITVRQASCAWCEGVPIREVIDGDALCQSCCDKWARSQAPEPA